MCSHHLRHGPGGREAGTYRHANHVELALRRRLVLRLDREQRARSAVEAVADGARGEREREGTACSLAWECASSFPAHPPRELLPKLLEQKRDAEELLAKAATFAKAVEEDAKEADRRFRKAAKASEKALPSRRELDRVAMAATKGLPSRREVESALKTAKRAQARVERQLKAAETSTTMTTREARALVRSLTQEKREAEVARALDPKDNSVDVNVALTNQVDMGIAKGYAQQHNFIAASYNKSRYGTGSQQNVTINIGDLHLDALRKAKVIEHE